MDLYLVRHAIAEPRDAERFPDDVKRPLTRRGRAVFRRVAHGLRELGIVVDVTLASPYVRAWQTAEILAEEASWPAPLACAELEAGIAPTVVFDLVRSRSETTIALVGHEPQLSRLAALIASCDPDGLTLELKKGGVVCLRLPDDGSSSGVLRWSVSPRILRRVGKRMRAQRRR